MATHSSSLAWKIPWTEEPGRLQSMGSQKVGHDWATSLSLSCIGEGNGNPLQCSCLENPRDGRASWTAIYGVAQSRTWLKRLSSSSSREWVRAGGLLKWGEECSSKCRAPRMRECSMYSKNSKEVSLSGREFTNRKVKGRGSQGPGQAAFCGLWLCSEC